MGILEFSRRVSVTGRLSTPQTPIVVSRSQETGIFHRKPLNVYSFVEISRPHAFLSRKVKIFSRPTSLCCATSYDRHGKRKSALVQPNFSSALRLSPRREHLVHHELRAQALAAALSTIRF